MILSTKSHVKVNSFKILLVNNQEIFRHGVRHIVCQMKDTVICGEAENDHEFLQLLNKENPDLIIMDIEPPVQNKLEILRKIKMEHPQVKALIMSGCRKREFIYTAVNLGVEGFILKEESGRELLRAVKVIRNDGKFFSSLLSGELMGLIRNKKQDKRFFTRREKEILQHLARGMYSREIAKSLDISLYTVRRHFHNIKKKLNMKHMTDLLKYCLLNKDKF